MSVKYRDYGLTKEEARKAIELAYHLKEHCMYRDAYNASHDGIQRANFQDGQARHGAKASEIIRKHFNYHVNINPI